MAEDDKTFTEEQVKEMIKAAVDEETSGLKSKVEELLGESKAAKAKARDAEEEARKKAEEAAKNNGDISALEKSWSEKFEAFKAEAEQNDGAKNAMIASLTSGATAKDMAAKLALKGSEILIENWVSQRLGVEIVDGVPKTIVKDANGQRSAATLEDLEKEILANPALRPVLAGTNGTGGGAANPGGGAVVKKWGEMNSDEKTALYRSNPQEYDRLKNAS